MASGALRAYGRMAAAQVRSQAQYRGSLALEIVSSVVFAAIDLLGVMIMFRVSRTLGGFRFPEVFLMAALAGCGFALADLAVGNVERMRMYVRTGLFDAMLVRPLGTLPQLVAFDFAPRRIGRVLFTFALLPVAVRVAHVRWDAARLVLLALTPIAGAALFAAVFVAGATVAFWWIDSGEFANAVTYGGRDFSSVPMTVYGALFRRVFAYGVGFAFVGYYPALALLRRRDPLGGPGWLGWAAPLAAAALLAAAGLLWRFAVRHYRSTGS